MLRPLYTRRAFELMLLGNQDSGKRTIATEFLKRKDVYYSTNLGDNMPKVLLARVDYVIALFDITNKESLKLLTTMLDQIDPTYAVTKFAIIVTKVDQREGWVYTLGQIREHVESYFSIPIFYANLSNHVERRVAVDQISQLIKASTSQSQNVNTLLLRSLESYSYDGSIINEEVSVAEEENEENPSKEEEDDIIEKKRSIEQENGDTEESEEEAMDEGSD